MEIFNITTGKRMENLDSYNSKELFFITGTQDDLDIFGNRLGILKLPEKRYNNHDENIRFETHNSYDFLSFVYFEVAEKDFAFETLNTYYGENYLLFIVPESSTLHQDFLALFIKENILPKKSDSSLSFLYYKLLEIAFTGMFEAMCRYETVLSGIETDIASMKQNYDLDKIVAIKTNCFEVKKCMRLLLYVGDQLELNDNQLIPEDDVRFFRNLDMRINRMYEFAANIHEMSEHLMELYNSAVASTTNDIINKLTIFTVFATPLTLLTGLYGMNFVNMPELQHEYGYFILLAVMAAIVFTTFLILKKIKLL